MRTSLAVILIFFLFSTSAHAEGLLSLGVTPIVGYHRNQRYLPSQHSVQQFVYGARVRAGILILSAEGEYTHGTNAENFADQGLTINDTDDKIKLGLRSDLRLGSLLSAHLRAGGEAHQDHRVQTLNGVSTTTDITVYHPYAGAGASVKLTSNFSATADAVAVIPSISDMSQNEYQVTAGFDIRFP